MGVDTKCIITDVSESKFIDFISSFSNNIEVYIKNSSHPFKREGYIHINFLNQKISIYCLLMDKKYESSNYPFLEGNVKEDYWWLSSRMNLFVIDVMNFIRDEFEGWIEEDDSKDIGFVHKSSQLYKERFIKKIFEV